MILLGRYLSPYTRRVAVSLKLLDMPFEHRPITAWHNLDEVRQYNPAGRIPALVLDDGEVIFDSSAILDHLDHVAGPGRALLPFDEPQRRADLRVLAVALGAMDKAAAARYELVMRPPETLHKPWLDHNLGQVRSGLVWLDAHFAGAPGGEAPDQTVITTVVLYDFLATVMPDHLELGAYAALAALSRRWNRMGAFAETHPDTATK